VEVALRKRKNNHFSAFQPLELRTAAVWPSRAGTLFAWLRSQQRVLINNMWLRWLFSLVVDCGLWFIEFGLVFSFVFSS